MSIDPSAALPKAVLEAELARLRHVVTFSTDVLFDVAPDDTFRWVSPAVTGLLEWAPSELVGRPDTHLVHPDDLDAYRAVRSHSDHDHTPAPRFRMITPDGSYRWVSGQSNEIRIDGKSVGRVVNIRDAEALVRSDAELRTSRERYRLLAENSSDVVFECDNSESFTWVTEGVTLLLGWRPQEVIGMPFQAFVHPDDLDSLTAGQERVAQGESQVIELRVQTVSGDYRWVSAAVRPLIDSDGRLAGRVGSWRDVTLQHLANEALARSEDMFRTAMDNSAIGMCLVGPDGSFLRVNPALCEILGRPPEVLMACTWQELTHPDDLAMDQALAQQMLAGETDTYRFRKRYLRPDGDVVWGELAVACVRNPDGSVRNFITQITDITEMQRSKEALEAAQRRYLLLAENASDVVFQADQDRKLVWVSPNVTPALGWTPDELLGTRMTALMRPEAVAATEEDRFEMYNLGHDAAPPGGYLIEFRTKTGGYRWFAGSAKPVLDEDGQPAGVVAGFKDVTDVVTARHRAEAREARRKAMLDTFLDPHVLLQAVRDEAGHIVDFAYADANQAAADYMQMSPEDLRGSTVLQLLPGQAGSGMLALYAEAVETGVPLVLDDYAYQHEILESHRRYDVRGVKVGDALSFTWRDVTERFTATRLIAESEERFRLLAENSSNVVLRSRDGRILWVSPSLTDMLGWSPQEWIDTNLGDHLHPEDRQLLMKAATGVAAGEVVRSRFRVRGKDGAFHWVDASSKAFIDQAGEADGAASSFSLADEAVAAEAELLRRARFDTLTGLLNRTEVLEQLDGVTDDRRSPGGETALLFCDIDKFKDTNDTLGHAAGDEVLRTIAARVCAAVRGTDTVARIGGDEMLVVLHGLHSLGEATLVAEKVLAAARAPIDLPRGQLSTSLSIGATLLRAGEASDDLVARADRAMYEAKKAGGNRIVAD